MATRPPRPDTPASPAPTAPAPPTSPPVRPIGTPPGGGRWTWDAQTAAWVPLPESAPSDPPPADQATEE